MGRATTSGQISTLFLLFIVNLYRLPVLSNFNFANQKNGQKIFFLFMKQRDVIPKDTDNPVLNNNQYD